MELQQRINQLKEEVNIVLQRFESIPEADKQPVLTALATSDSLWEQPGWVAPDVLQDAYDTAVAAFEDLCVQHQISQELIDTLLQRPQMIRLSTTLIIHNAAKAKLELIDGDLSRHVAAAYDAYCAKWEGKMSDVEREGIRAQLALLGFEW